MLAERGVNVDHTTFIVEFSIMLQKWKNGYAGIGVILQIYIHGIWMKLISGGV
jgi:hypothetical protein